MVVVDSSVWVDYFNGRVTKQTDILDSLLGRELLVIGDIILTEVLQGFRSDREFRKAKRILDSLIFMPMMGKELAFRSAENYRYLRKKGITVRKTIDVIIATFCIANGFALLHDDKDFEPMEKHLSLTVVN
jgi:predicted nucleic acid-binding protein